MKRTFPYIALTASKKGITSQWGWLQAVLKWVVFAFTILYLYNVWQGQKLAIALNALATELANGEHIILLYITFSLIFVNWGLEAWKWRVLVKPFSPVRMTDAVKAVLAGTSVSLWVPNRAGEYVGRIFFLQPSKRVRGILATLIGSMAQLLTTVIAGAAGLMYYVYHHMGNPFLGKALIVLILASITVLLFIYFNVNKIRSLLPHSKFFRPLRRYLIIYRKFSAGILAEVLFYSVLRYIVFCGQFVLLLIVYHAGVHITDAFFTIFIIYLVQAVLPGNSITELATRGASSVLFLSAFTYNVAAISAATYTLWLINVIMPAILGLGFFMFAKYKRKTTN